MKQIKLSDAKKYLDFLEDHKHIVGLSDWTIKVNLKEFEESGTIARAVPDYYEKEMVIYLSEAFLKMEDSRKVNILLHELIHGRVLLFNLMVEEFELKEEELMVNDITRGFERITEFKL
jgi:hypothetical protein